MAFGASNSSRSINKSLATHAVNQIENIESEILDLNDYEMPIYSIDREREDGIPDLAQVFKQKIRDCDGIIISFAEHNGAYTTAFKNIFDWISRIEKNIWCDKPMLLLATSPGARGGKTVLEIAAKKFRRMSSAQIEVFSLPSFFDNFSQENGIINQALAGDLEQKIKIFRASL